jgi:hypothetical protein
MVRCLEMIYQRGNIERDLHFIARPVSPLAPPQKVGERLDT